MSTFIHLKPASSSHVTTATNMQVELTDLENQICTLLDKCADEIKQEKGIAMSCRIAGGWVRDKVNIEPAAFSTFT